MNLRTLHVGPLHRFRLPSLDSMNAEWARLANAQKLTIGEDPRGGGTVYGEWALPDLFDYIFGFRDVVDSMRFPTGEQRFCLIVRGDGMPLGGETWCQLTVGFANHGWLARTLSYMWTCNVALCAEKESELLGDLFQNNLATLQGIIDSGHITFRGWSYPCDVILGGDDPWLRMVLGLSKHWRVGSIFSFATLCGGDRSGVGGNWVGEGVERTLAAEDQLRALKAMGVGAIQLHGCTKAPMLRTPNRWCSVPCILHTLICIERQGTVKTRQLAKRASREDREAFQAVLYKHRAHIALGGRGMPDGEDTWGLLKAWKEAGSLLGPPELPSANVGMLHKLTCMYRTMFQEDAIGVGPVANEFHRLVCPKLKSPDFRWLTHRCF